MDQKQKDAAYNLLLLNKMKIFNRKNSDSQLRNFLEKNEIKFDFEISVKNIISYLKGIDTKCKNINCTNDRKFLGFRTREKEEYGFQNYCSTKCFNNSKSIRQLGKNNSCHKMTDKSFKSMCEKNSNHMKNKIKSGKFTPCITNSWSGSKSKLIINDLILEYRSSWEAFFHLCNQHLEYEKIRIPYLYKEKYHNYIVDFVDRENSIIYEIKPDRCLNSDRVKSKLEYAKKWCLENNFKFEIVGNNWFKLNFSKNKILLNNQENGNIILKKLKQFE